MIICKIRLALTEAGLSQGYIIENWRVPSPSLPVYSDHSQKIAGSDGSQSLRGFRSFSLTWDVLDQLQRRTIRRISEEAIDLGGGLLYATIDRGWNGAGPIDDWIDVRGEAHIPQITPIGNSNGMASASVTLFVNNVTTINDPASF